MLKFFYNLENDGQLHLVEITDGDITEHWWGAYNPGEDSFSMIKLNAFENSTAHLADYRASQDPDNTLLGGRYIFGGCDN